MQYLKKIKKKLLVKPDTKRAILILKSRIKAKNPRITA